MSDTWASPDGGVWYGYWSQRLDKTWGYLMHPQGADTDMGDMEIAEVEKSFGPLTRGEMVDVKETVVRKRFRAS